MVFFLKKLIGGWLMPLPLALTLVALGLLLWRRRRVSLALILSAFSLLFVCSLPVVAGWLIEPLESRYPRWQPVEGSSLGFVIVMGGSHVDVDRLPLTNRLNTASIYRLLEGVAIQRANPGSRLLLSGGAADGRSNAELMAETAVALGVEKESIVLQRESRDTEQEARLLAEIVMGQRGVVVTSALHMPRTMAAFARVGLQPTPAPTHFLDRRSQSSWKPGLDHLAASSAALHEYLGLAWMALRSSE